MKSEIYKRFMHGILRLSEARRRMVRQIIMKTLRMPWQQTVSVLFLPKDYCNVEIIDEAIPPSLVDFPSTTAKEKNFSHYFRARINLKLHNPLIDLSSGDVFLWDKLKSRWSLVEETSEWPIEYRIQFAKVPGNLRKFPKLEGTFVNGILSRSHYHRLTEDIPTLLTLGSRNPILAKSKDLSFLTSFALSNFEQVADSGLVQVEELNIITKGNDVGYLLPEYREILKFTMTKNDTSCEPKKLIYLTRIDKRRSIPNEFEILELMRSLEFEIISPETLTLREQASLFAEAKLVVAPHGGAITNMVFAGDAELIEIMPNSRINRCFEWQSRVCGHGYTRLLFDEKGINCLMLKTAVIEILNK